MRSRYPYTFVKHLAVAVSSPAPYFALNQPLRGYLRHSRTVFSASYPFNFFLVSRFYLFCTGFLLFLMDSVNDQLKKSLLYFSNKFCFCSEFTLSCASDFLRSLSLGSGALWWSSETVNVGDLGPRRASLQPPSAVGTASKGSIPIDFPVHS